MWLINVWRDDIAFMLRFHQCFFKVFTLFVPEAYISPCDKAAHQEENWEEDKWHPKSNTGKNQKTIEAAQRY